MQYHIITLGCPKNNVDSEGMHGILSAQGHISVADIDDADVVIVNTCSFIAAARDETLEVLRELGVRKVPGQRLIAAGCMAESHAELVQAIPGVDSLLSTRQWMQIGNLFTPGEQPVGGMQPHTQRQGIPLMDLQPVVPGRASAPGYVDWRNAPIRRLSGGPSAYLKISDGCNLRCAFCTIPSFKGDMRSKAVGAVLGEARELAARGVQEIILVAQHLTDYGRDLGLREGLAHLLDELCAVLPAHVWVRLMYAYPHAITPRLVDVMARHPQVCAYLDMPLQHAHPATLRRMRRPPDTEQTLELITALRASLPDIALRSTFIVGFPGETSQEFRALIELVEQVQFDRVGAFRYSQEPGTAAATLPDQVRPRVIERRWHELMQLQQQISLERNRRWVGRTIEVLVEGQGTTEDGQMLLVGRSFRDAPEVDGQVFVWGNATVGSRVQVRVDHAAEYDLWGTCIPNEDGRVTG